MKKLKKSFGFAMEGIFTALKTERNMKIHFMILCLVLFAGIFFKISRFEWILCICCFGLVLSGELFNTAIEAVVDIASPEISVKAKLAKDVAAGGVLVLAIASFLIGLAIFLPKILVLF